MESADGFAVGLFSSKRNPLPATHNPPPAESAVPS